MELLVTLGIVFGDIGTSPLYVMKAVYAACPEAGADYFIGAVSCVIWTLTLQTTVKYVVIALRADNRGEGGYSRPVFASAPDSSEMAVCGGRRRRRHSDSGRCDHTRHYGHLCGRGA